MSYEQTLEVFPADFFGSKTHSTNSGTRTCKHTNKQMLNKNYYFNYNCVSPKNGDEHEYIIDNMKNISADLFLRNVSLDEINNSLLYGIRYSSKDKIKSDWGLSFYRIKKKGIDAFILVNSCTEYVFKKA